MPERVLSLQFPAGGQNRFFGIQRQAPFTTAECLNVRPFDAIDERLRGGSRPGLSKYKFWLGGFPKPVGAGPINLLSCINVAAVETLTPSRFTDDFTRGAADALWRSVGLQVRQAIGLFLLPGFSAGGRLQRPRPSHLDEAAEYFVRCRIDAVLDEPTGERVISGVVRIGIGVHAEDDERPFEHFEVELKGIYNPPIAGQGIELSLLRFSGHFLEDRQILYTVDQEQGQFLRWLVLGVRVHPGSPQTITVTLQAEDDPFSFSTGDPKAIPRVTGTDLSLFLSQGFTGVIENPLVTSYSIDFFILTPNAFPIPGCLLVANSAGQFWIRLDENDLATPRQGQLEQTLRPLMAFDMIGPPDTLAQRSAGPFLFVTDHGINGATGLPIKPKFYDPRANFLKEWKADLYEAEDEPPSGLLGEPKGTVPIGNFIMARFNGRMYLAGDPPHAWYASRIGDPFDYDDGQNVFHAGGDPAAAIFGQVAELSVISEPLRALVPYSDDYMIFATANKLYRMGGDPGFGGRSLLISSQVGMAGPTAWCPTPESEMIFLDGERGLFLLGPGGLSFPKPLSDKVLPRELRNIDPRDVVVSLAYDHQQPGVHIMLASTQGRELINFWYDRRTERIAEGGGLTGGGFWPVKLAKQEYTPLTLLAYQNVDPDLSGVLLGCQDGFIRRFDRPEPEDDGDSFSTSLLYGPFRLGGRDHLEGVLNWVRGQLVTANFSPSFDVVTATTAEGALNGQNEKRRLFTSVFPDEPMVQHSVLLRGVVAYLRIRGRQSAWAMETLDVAVEPVAAPHP